MPYCRELCLYCGCNTKKALRDDVIGAYREALEREIALVGETASGPLRVSRLHWGGGTPSILGAEGLASVVESCAGISSLRKTTNTPSNSIRDT